MKIAIRVILILFSLVFIFIMNFNVNSGVNSSINSNDWTWSYRHKIPDNKDIDSKSEYIFSKVGVPPYNQLIFSWNANRPKNGFFTFYVQPRYAITKAWGLWYKMIDWGNNIQQSYNWNDVNASYMYVRLELPKHKLADGFRLKIEPNKGAKLSDLILLSICISNFANFNKEDSSTYLPYVEIPNVPKISQMLIKHQDNKDMCSPTSLTMLLNYLSKEKLKFDPLNVALNVYDKGLKAYGSWPFNIAHAFELYPDYFFRVIRLNSFSELHSYISRKLPVIVSVRGKLAGAPLEYGKGHLILVVGWYPKTKKVICHDPAFEDNKKVRYEYDIDNFLRAWENSNRLVYIAEKRQ